jgi:hypothetical protein
MGFYLVHRKGLIVYLFFTSMFPRGMIPYNQISNYLTSLAKSSQRKIGGRNCRIEAAKFLFSVRIR